MGRRQKSLIKLLAVAPWWISIVIALVVYAACSAAPLVLHAQSPLLASVNILAVVLSRNAHWVAAPFLVLAAVAVFNRQRRERLLARQSDIDSIRDLSWQDFELLIGEAFRQQGFAVEETGGGGADGGVDLRLRRDGKTYVVQCKRWKQRQVPVMAVRELFGLLSAEKADGGYFVSCGSFTPDAREFATANGVTLVDGDGLMELLGRAPRVPASASSQSPHCPSCGGQMVMRTAKRGAKAGESFWGCESFPRCRGVVAAT
jgi:restriction system protein